MGTNFWWSYFNLLVVSQIFLIFIPKIGEDSHFGEYFSDGLKPPTSIHLFLMRFCVQRVYLWRCWKGGMLTKKKPTLRWKRSRFQYWFSNLKGTCDSMSKSPSAAVVSHLYNDGYCSADDAGVVVSVNWWIVFHCRCWIGLVWIPTSTLRMGYFTCMHCFVSNFIVGDLGMIFIVYIFDCASNDSMIG